MEVLVASETLRKRGEGTPANHIPKWRAAKSAFSLPDVVFIYALIAKIRSNKVKVASLSGRKWKLLTLFELIFLYGPWVYGKLCLALVAATNILMKKMLFRFCVAVHCALEQQETTKIWGNHDNAKKPQRAWKSGIMPMKNIFVSIAYLPITPNCKE